MSLTSIRTLAFRNLLDAETSIRGNDIFLVGENGQGKSNFLEALYFCCYASSFRGVRDSDLANNGKNDFSAEIKITGSADSENNILSDNILVKAEKGKKTVLINGKRTEDRKDLLYSAPCIVFCHEDMEFVSGSHEKRRWFFDQVLSLYDAVYLDDLRRFRHVLKSRNSVLRDYAHGNLAGDHESILDALDAQFVLYGSRLMEKRKIAAELFSGIFGPLYRDVSGLDGITVKYVPSWKDTDDVAQIIAERRSADLSAGISLCGPHRDRYVFNCQGDEFAGKASTGQRRLLALLLRVAQARRFSEMTGKKPILLLDDVLLEMDGEKRQKFFSVMPDYDQGFYTFLPEEPYHNYRKDDSLVYHVNGGIVS